MAKFQPVIRSARFVFSPYTPQQMAGFAQLLANTVKARIQSGQNIYDQPAAPLKMSTMKQKSRDPNCHGDPSVRNWTWTGFTLRCMKVLEATENQAIIGFLPEPHPYMDRRGKAYTSGSRPTAAQIAFYNNQREVQFGTSARDKAVVVAEMSTQKQYVTVQSLPVAA